VNDKNLRQTIMGPFITTPQNVNFVTSLEKLDKFDRTDKGSLATTDVSSKQTLQCLSRTLVESRSLNKTGDELIIGRIVPGISPLQAKFKGRPSLKSLKTVVEKKVFEKNVCDTNQTTDENLENHKAFKLLGQKAKALGLHLKRATPCTTGLRCVSAMSIHNNESQL